MNILKIGQKIKEERLKRNYTLEELAKELNISKSTLSNYENEGIDNIEKIQIIADFFHINIAKLLSDDLEEIKINDGKTFYNSSKFSIINIKNDLDKATILKEMSLAIKSKKSIYVFINNMEIANNTYGWIKDNYKVNILNFQSNTPCGYNPLSNIIDDKDIFKLVDFIINNSNNKNIGPLLIALIAFLFKYRPKEEQNLTSIMKLLRAAEIDDSNQNALSPLDRIFNEVRKRDLDSIALKQYMIYKLSENKQQIIMDCAKLFGFSEIKEFRKFIVNPNEVNFNNLNELQITYIIMPEKNSVLNLLYCIFVFQLSEALQVDAMSFNITNSDLNEYILKLQCEFDKCIASENKEKINDMRNVVEVMNKSKRPLINKDLLNRKIPSEMKKVIDVQPISGDDLYKKKGKKKIDFNKPVEYNIIEDINYKFPIMDKYNIELTFNSESIKSQIVICPLYIPQNENVEEADILVYYIDDNTHAIYSTKNNYKKEIIIRRLNGINIEIKANWINGEFITKLKTNCIDEKIELEKTRLEDLSDFDYLQLNIKYINNPNLTGDKLRIYPIVLNKQMNFIYTFEYGHTIKNGISKTSSFLIEKSSRFSIHGDDIKNDILLYCQCLKQDNQLIAFAFSNKSYRDPKYALLKNEIDIQEDDKFIIDNYLNITNYIKETDNYKISRKYNYDQYKIKNVEGQDIVINIIPINDNAFINKNLDKKNKQYFSIAYIYNNNKEEYTFLENNINTLSFEGLDFCIVVENVTNKNYFKTNLFSINTLNIFEKNTYRTNDNKNCYDNIFKKEILTNYISDNESLYIYTIPVKFNNDVPCSILTYFYDETLNMYTCIQEQNPFKFTYDNNTYQNSIVNNLNIIEKIDEHCTENNINQKMVSLKNNQFAFDNNLILKNICKLSLYDEFDNDRKELTHRQAKQRKHNKTKEFKITTIPLEKFTEEKNVDFLLIAETNDTKQYLLSDKTKINNLSFNEHNFSITCKYLSNGTFSTRINPCGITKIQQCVKEREYEKEKPKNNKLGYATIELTSKTNSIKLSAIPIIDKYWKGGAQENIIFILNDSKSSTKTIAVKNNIFKFTFNDEEYTAKLSKRDGEFVILLQKNNDIVISGCENVVIKDVNI